MSDVPTDDPAEPEPDDQADGDQTLLDEIAADLDEAG